LKLRIEIADDLYEHEIIVRCNRVDDKVSKLQEFIRTMSTPQLTFYKGTHEYYLPLESILFFETEGEQIYAHTTNDSYRIKRRLYELEEILPRSFVRAAKGTIVNTNRIHAINRSLTGASQVGFAGTHKQIYVSRHYFNTLKEKMNERRT